MWASQWATPTGACPHTAFCLWCLGTTIGAPDVTGLAPAFSAVMVLTPTSAASTTAAARRRFTCCPPKVILAQRYEPHRRPGAHSQRKFVRFGGFLGYLNQMRW